MSNVIELPIVDGSAIEWTDYTHNPWWGCQKVSPGCKHCYAEAYDQYRAGGLHWGPGSRRMLSDGHWRRPRRWNARAERAGRPALVFCASMADVLEAHPDPTIDAQLDEQRARLFDIIDETPWLRWLLLTKRPQHLVPEGDHEWGDSPCKLGSWRPPPSVWFGTTTENVAEASWRLRALAAGAQAAGVQTTFASYEPALEAVDFTRLPGPDGGDWDALRGAPGMPGLSWLIAGGESGAASRVRPFDLRWALNTRDACDAAGVAFFFKQAGRRPLLDGNPVDMRHTKGADPAEWPAGLQGRRAWPAGAGR